MAVLASMGSLVVAAVGGWSVIELAEA